MVIRHGVCTVVDVTLRLSLNSGTSQTIVREFFLCPLQMDAVNNLGNQWEKFRFVEKESHSSVCSKLGGVEPYTPACLWRAI